MSPDNPETITQTVRRLLDNSQTTVRRQSDNSQHGQLVQLLSQSYSFPDVLANRRYLESRLSCGVPNTTTVNDEEAKTRGRRKRVVGGVAAKPASLSHLIT